MKSLFRLLKYPKHCFIVSANVLTRTSNFDSLLLTDLPYIVLKIAHSLVFTEHHMVFQNEIYQSLWFDYLFEEKYAHV
ncbi:hypothetical protein SAMN04515667_2179 [Formosa sp. Hel1_31_208]|nr:hypothetical protein SAMN04515667_2179 [Formosa sp. Hel1_31_208]